MALDTAVDTQTTDKIDIAFNSRRRANEAIDLLLRYVLFFASEHGGFPVSQLYLKLNGLLCFRCGAAVWQHAHLKRFKLRVFGHFEDAFHALIGLEIEPERG